MRFLRRVARLLSWAYLGALLALSAFLSVLGESYWLTTALLYVPRILYALPLLVLVPLLWVTKTRELLWTQAVAGLIVLFPLMGFVLPGPVDSARGPTLKILSLNVDSANYGAEQLLSVVDRESPDLVLFQEAPWAGALHDGLRARFAHVEGSTQFIVASRFPILGHQDPDKVKTADRLRSPRFIRYLLDSSLGKLAVYNIHPISPRGALDVNSFRGVLHSVRTGAILEGDRNGELLANAQLRVKQVAAVAAMAGQERYPVVIAGDTNLPGLSPALSRHLGAYTDAFRSASRGFGYTYPAKHPFLRLDRILLSPELGASEFRVGCPGVSDHLCVISRLFRR